MKKIFIVFFVLILINSSSCELLEGIEEGLTTEEVIEGLKKALKIGTDTATTKLSVVNGYYSDALLKIPLPEEAEEIRDLVTNNALASFFDLDQKLFEDIVHSVNKAAENAAKEAGPVFVNSIENMTVTDAMDILKGKNPAGTLKISQESFDSIAATNYFKVNTYNELVDIYAPKINTALDKDLGLGQSANYYWEFLTSNYNAGIELINSNFITEGLDEEWGLPPAITTDLGEFSTGKALDGLFYMVGEEEKKIRKDPYNWAVDIIQKVFGSVVE